MKMLLYRAGRVNNLLATVHCAIWRISFIYVFPFHKQIIFNLYVIFDGGQAFFVSVLFFLTLQRMQSLSN